MASSPPQYPGISGLTPWARRLPLLMSLRQHTYLLASPRMEDTRHASGLCRQSCGYRGGGYLGSTQALSPDPSLRPHHSRDTALPAEHHLLVGTGGPHTQSRGRGEEGWVRPGVHPSSVVHQLWGLGQVL